MPNNGTVYFQTLAEGTYAVAAQCTDYQDATQNNVAIVSGQGAGIVLRMVKAAE